MIARSIPRVIRCRGNRQQFGHAGPSRWPAAHWGNSLGLAENRGLPLVFCIALLVMSGQENNLKGAWSSSREGSPSLFSPYSLIFCPVELQRCGLQSPLQRRGCPRPSPALSQANQ